MILFLWWWLSTMLGKILDFAMLVLKDLIPFWFM